MDAEEQRARTPESRRAAMREISRIQRESPEKFVELFDPRDRGTVTAWLERCAARGVQGDSDRRLPQEWALMTEEEQAEFKEEGS